MRCERCGREVSAEDALSRDGRRVCEDCLMDLLSPAKACDPWAVKMARGSMGTTADGVASLRGLEKSLYELVSERGRVSRGDLPKLLAVTPGEVERAFSVLRHMELLRGEKAEDGQVFCVRF